MHEHSSGSRTHAPCAPRQSRGSTPHVSVALAGCALTLGVAWVAWGPIPEEEKLPGVLVLALTVASFVLLTVRGRAIVHPDRMLAAIVLPFFVIVPQLHLGVADGTRYHIGDVSTSFVAAALIVLLFVGAFVMGERLSDQRSAAAERSLQRRPTALHSRARTRQVVILLATVGAIAWVAYFRMLGGLVFYIDNIQNKTQLASGLGYLFLAANLFQVAVLIAAMSHAAESPVLPRTVVTVMALAAFGLVLISGSRSRAVMFLLVIAVQSYVLGKRAGVLRWGTIALFGAGVIFASGQIRSLGTGTGAILDAEAVVEAVRRGDSTRLDRLVTDYGHFDRLSLVFEYVPDRLPLQWGATLASGILIPVPRAWFANKPVGSGPLLANALRPGAWDLEAGWVSGVTPTLPGELFLNFWWPGVFLGGLVCGLWASRTYRRYVERGKGAYDALKYALAAIFLVMAGMLGEFYGTLIAYGVYAAPVYCAAWYADGRAAPTSRSQKW